MSDIDILLVEDNPGDTHLLKRLFEDQEIRAELHTVQTGDEALEWLYQQDEFADAPRPDLVLLDLNLPATSGQAVLEEIKSDPQLKRMPVIVLTGSDSDQELNEAYDAYANACLVKPVDPSEFTELIQTFADFWVATAVLPPISESVNGPQC